MAKKGNKKKVIDKFKKHVDDTGSAAVQIGLLTERISYLTDHLKENKKDFSSRRGLLVLVGRRRNLLRYLKKEDPQKYKNVTEELKLHK
jgi:small subunit ribosomal protein S15